jgi:hypothetical protein
MKRTPLKQVGKIGRLNQKANRELEKLWIERGIHFCEVCSVLAEMGLLNWQCMQSNTNAHRHGRTWYRTKPELLWDYGQVVRACMPAHTFIDNHAEIKERVFLVLRGEE